MTRRRDPADRRVHVVELTGARREMFARLRNAAVAHDEQLRTGPDADDVARLDDLLDRRYRNVTGDEPERGVLAPDGAESAHQRLS